MNQKSLFALNILFSLIFLCSCNLKAQTNRQILFSIGADESAVYGESEIFLENSGTKASLVTKDNNGNFFLYDKGVRKGPFGDIKSCNFETADNNESLYSSIFNSEGGRGGQDLASTNEAGRAIIKSGDKTFGPFESILNIWLDANGKFLLAVTVEGMKYSLLLTDGTLIPIDGVPYATIISPSGNKIVMTVIKEENPAMDFINQDFSGMSSEELLKISKEMEEKQKNAPPPEAYVYLNDGKKFGPFPKDAVYGGNPFFTKTSGDNWLFLNDRDLYVNGTLLNKIPLDYVSTGDLWLSEDGKRYAVIAFDKIFFSDGQSFGYPLRTRMLKKEGKTWLSWICLENSTNIVLYSRAL